MKSKNTELSKIENHQDDGISFYADYFVEIFDAPLPAEDSYGSEIETASDLFRMSEGFDELFLTKFDVVRGESKGKQLLFSRENFLRWQLERFSAVTLYHLAAKTDARIASSCNTDYEPEEKLLDFDTESELDPEFNPDDWLNENILDDNNKQNGLALVERLRNEKPDKFYKLIIDGILSEDSGLLSWLETEIDDDLADVRESYAHWSVPIVVVSEGNFVPYIDPESLTHLMMDQESLYRMYVRNYDEDEKA